jgi:polymorphic toxin system DSP-PTPase phosphatase-like protein
VNTQDPLNPILDRPLANSYWVIPGRLLAGEHPAGVDEADACVRLERLHQAGIHSYVDLTEPGEQPEYRHLLPERTDYLRSAIADCGVPYNVSQTQALLSAIRDALARERGIYVHCRAGIGRTGLIIGCFLAEEERTGKAAIKRLNRLWRQSARSDVWPTVPQTAEQADYIRHWPKLRKLGT